MTGPRLIPARSAEDAQRLVRRLLDEPSLSGRLQEVRVPELKDNYSGAFMVHATWDGAPALVKVGVTPTEARWTRAVAAVDPGALPALFASGDSIDAEPLAWLAMERCPETLSWTYGPAGYRLLMEAGVRFHRATRQVAPRPGPGDVDVARFCRVLRHSLATADVSPPDGAEELAATIERDMEWVLSICEVEQCHGDLHPSNAVLRVPPPDPAAQALLVDVSSAALPWAYEPAYCEIVFWPTPLPDGHPTMTHLMAAVRARHGISVPSAADLDRLATLYRGWHAVRGWSNARHRTHHPDYEAAARAYIKDALAVSRSLG